MRTESVDVVVIGSGAGGSPVALELACAGARVVVLEKGRWADTEDFSQDEIRMIRRNFFVPFPWEEAHTVRYGATAPAVRSSEFWTSNIVGGGTVHMSGYFFRMKPVDMLLRSTLGPIPGANHADWPVTYSALEPFYQRAEQELGVSGVWRSHPFEEPRSADYPLPPVDEHPLAARLDAVGRTLGLHPFATPRAVLSRPWKGRSACVYCPLCRSVGCKVGAKSSTAATLLLAALATGRCEVRPRSMAVEIELDSHGQARQVAYRGPDGAMRAIRARCVVVACSAIESARLLLLSRSALFPNGLANGSGLVGRNLMFSGLGIGRAHLRYAGHDNRAWLRDPSPFVQRTFQDLYLLDSPRRGVRKAGTVLFRFPHPGPIQTAERVSGAGPAGRWGPSLKLALREEVAGTRHLEFETFAEFLATDGSYVDLDPREKDRWGMPVARVTITRHPLDLAATQVLVDAGLNVLRGLSPDGLHVVAADQESRMLQAGTCRFGKDPATSVLDPTCRAHEVSNLYVTDGSFLPTSSGVPHTLTTIANGFRVGSVIAGRFRAGAL